jgi:hypothetical protein
VSLRIKPIEDSEVKIDMSNLKETLQYHDGRYNVNWLWMDNKNNLPTNCELELGIKLTVTRLHQNSDLMNSYDNIIKDVLQNRKHN